jgi:hypothetical protein
MFWLAHQADRMYVEYLILCKWSCVVNLYKYEVQK